MRIIFENTQNTRPILENSLKYIRSDVPTVLSEKLWMIEHNVITIVACEQARQHKKVCPLKSDVRFSCIRIFKGSPYEFSCAGLLAGLWEKTCLFPSGCEWLFHRHERQFSIFP